MVITISSWKGGTGKTTLNVALAKILASRGKKVLVIDLDANCAISRCFGLKDGPFNSMKFLTETEPQASSVYCVQRARENIDVIPSSLRMMLLNNIMDTQLKIALRRSGFLRKYDYIIIDPPGYWGSHTRNAVFAADRLVIPGTCSDIDFKATQLYFSELQNCGLEGTEVFVCVNASNTKTNLPGILEAYKEEFGVYMLDEPIPFIRSIKRLTENVDYTLPGTVRYRLECFADSIVRSGEGE